MLEITVAADGTYCTRIVHNLGWIEINWILTSTGESNSQARVGRVWNRHATATSERHGAGDAWRTEQRSKR